MICNQSLSRTVNADYDMKTPLSRRLFAGVLVCCLIAPSSGAWAQEADSATLPAAKTDPAAANQLPDSPGFAQLQAANQQASDPGPQSASSPASPQNQTTSNQTTSPPQTKQPLGTAAAEDIGPSGVAGSRPVGAALAPMPQKRVRLLIIKVGAVLAAGAAVGTTLALSHASPSRPPGSH